MNFKELVQILEERIGYHQVPINPTATGPKDLFECCALHHEVMTEVVRAIFDANDCRTLTDPVDRQKTFQALSPIRLKILRSTHTDIDVFHLIENLCIAVDQAFSSREGHDIPTPRRRRHAPVARKAEVLELDNYRYRRFKSLA
ncbi:MAG: hypothetical protein BMS9Abin10_0861 [Gammaproteobacteria bacterium]|nr:MAG: hypothetical protein BMS9Abin10_0861 [Gammaproteobacteria bacterium]